MPVVFDIDGTLIRLEERFDVFFERAVAEVLGHEAFSREWYRYPNVTDAGIVHHIFEQDRGRPATEPEFRRIADLYIDGLERNGGRGEPIAGAQAFLDLVRESGRAVAIATGNCERSARWKLRASGLDVGSIPMATSDDSIRRAEIIATAIERAGGGDDPVYFGDGEHDRRAARAAGVRFVHVCEGGDLADYTDVERAWALLNGQPGGAHPI